ncbi:MAG: class I SAM-dependent methyltransferase [Acidimicrobiales bacterium]
MAESFGTDPERYDRSRPSYPQAMIDAILAASPGLDVLDVGVGTGIAARQFQAAGARVLGVDVDARMADFARRHGTEVEVGAFEGWEPDGRSFDLVIAGQTWHWIDPVAGAAKAAQALRPGGRLAVFWNAFEPPPALAAATAEVYRQAMPTRPAGSSRARSAADGYSLMAAKAAEGIRQTGDFAEPEEWRFHWQRCYTRDEWLDQLPTSGNLTTAPPDKLEALLAGVSAAIDSIGGSLTADYTTVVGTATRTAS